MIRSSTYEESLRRFAVTQIYDKVILKASVYEAVTQVSYYCLGHIKRWLRLRSSGKVFTRVLVR